MFTGGILHIFTKTVGKKKEPLFAVLLSWAFVQASCVYCISISVNQQRVSVVIISLKKIVLRI